MQTDEFYEFCNKYELYKTDRSEIEKVMGWRLFSSYPWLIEAAAEQGEKTARYEESTWGGDATRRVSVLTILAKADAAEEALQKTIEELQAPHITSAADWWRSFGVELWTPVLESKGVHDSPLSSNEGWDSMQAFVHALGERLR